MPLANPTSANAVKQAGANCPTSAQLSIVSAVSDSTATAATSGELIAPFTFGGSNCRWIKVGPNGGKAMFRVKYHVSTDMTTAPIIYVIGAVKIEGAAEPAPQFATDGTAASVMRLDALSGVAGTTLTRVAATDQRDSTNRFTTWYSFTNPVTGVVGDLGGATHVLVLCSTASVGGTGVIEMGLIN